MKILRIENTVVAYINGQMIQKKLESLDQVINLYEECINADTEKQVEALLKPLKTQQEIQQELDFENIKKEVKAKLTKVDEVLDKKYNGNTLFEKRNKSVYMVGINLSIPEFLFEAIYKCNDDKKLQSLVNFWKLCAMNPDPRARHDLFKFLDGGKFTITQGGYFVAYRNVILKNTSDVNSKLKEYVRIHTDIVKKRWKKSLKNFFVVKLNGLYVIVEKGKISNIQSNSSFEFIGSLKELNDPSSKLYKSMIIESETVYTDQHTRTFNIKIGELVKMDRSKCNSNPEIGCSYGLHVGNKKFLSRGSFGNTGIAVLVNPSKVVAVPKENVNKMRVCEYLPISEVKYDNNGSLIEVDTDFMEYTYSYEDTKKLEEMISKTNFKFEELKKNELIPYEIDHATLKNIKLSLKEVSDKINSRTVKMV